MESNGVDNEIIEAVCKVIEEVSFVAVIISRSNGTWVMCKHKERDTYEVPGGHREEGEDILDTAKRELQI